MKEIGAISLLTDMTLNGWCGRVDTMSRTGCVNYLGLLIAILLFVGGVGWGTPLSLHLDAVGGLDAKLVGLAFSATLEGEGLLDGTAPCSDGVVCLTATSDVTGLGVYDILNLETKAWILALASGVTSTGHAFSIRSLAYISRQDAVPLKIGDLFEGMHQTVIRIGDVVEIYRGSFSGTLTGGLSTTGSDGLLRLVGGGQFTLSGERILADCSAGFPASIPLDDPDLSAEFLNAIEEAFR